MSVNGLPRINGIIRGKYCGAGEKVMMRDKLGSHRLDNSVEPFSRQLGIFDLAMC